MIRLATHDDIPALIEMGREFVAQSSDAIVPFDEAGTVDMFRSMIDADAACVFISDDGFICGVITALPYLSKKFTVANECFWYAESSGSDLFEAFERWAVQSGASRAIISHRHCSRTPSFERLYRMRGYAPHEHYYVRDLPCA